MTMPALRTASALLAVLGLAALASASQALAAPTVTSFKITPVPIPGFAGTGNILGAGAAIQGETAITGSEYGGSPPPLTEFEFYAPAGTKLHPQGFGTCAPAALEAAGPESCPKNSIAGLKGSALGTVTFGSERVPETASVQLFFAPGGSLEAFVRGATPALFEILATAHITDASPPFGLELYGSVPLIETVPGGLDASFEEGSLLVGAAFKHGNKTISYITLPKHCPKGGLPVKERLGFLGGASAEATYKMPCPRK